MRRTKLMLVITVIVLLSVGAVGAMQSQARKHSHGLTVKLIARVVSLPSNGVAASVAVCPGGYRATGGGYKSSQIAYVPTGEMFNNAYRAIAVNATSSSGTLEADVICIKTSTTAVSASNPYAGLAAQVAQLRRQRQAMQH